MDTVVVTSRSFSTGPLDLNAELAAAGLQVLRGPADHDRAVLGELLGEAVAWIAGTGRIDDSLLELAPHLKVIARYGVGFEAVDLAATTRRGIIVTNTPGANSAAVADHAIALMLAVLRHIPGGDRNVRAGDWKALRGSELGRQVVGIVGFGRIGQLVAQRLSGFGAQVVAFDPWPDDEVFTGAQVRRVELEELLTQATVISLHRPGGDTVIDHDAMARIRPGAVLINTARPELVDESQVAAALRDGRLTGFGADTLVGDVAASQSALLASDLADRVVVTPHSAAQTVEAIDAMGQLAVANVVAVLAGDDPPNPVPISNAP